MWDFFVDFSSKNQKDLPLNSRDVLPESHLGQKSNCSLEVLAFSPIAILAVVGRREWNCTHRVARVALI
jgi:hypothetical protein